MDRQQHKLSAAFLEDHGIAEALVRTWEPFFDRHGRLTEVQRLAIPVLLQGSDAVIASPTASGKTEAVCAPIVERRLRVQGPWTVLFICPTRALVNDLYQRMEGPLGRLGLRLARRTGDSKTSLDPPPNVLITTPESFDSLMCRGRVSPDLHVLQYVSAVILDEVHLLYGTARGEMVRWLMERLRRFRSQYARARGEKTLKIQAVALSATIGGIRGVMEHFCPGGEMIEVAGSREIELVPLPYSSGNVEDVLPAYLRQRGASEKLLVFCNSRGRVEYLTQVLAQPLRELGCEVHAHHGSLGAGHRADVEEKLRQSERLVVLATSTLELGIDVGDIDLVVLDGPPPNTSAFLQRIGRGNRRTNQTRVMMCFQTAREQLVQKAMLDAATRGLQCDDSTGQNFATSIQQLESYIFQTPRRRSRSERGLKALAEKLLGREHALALLDYLITTQQLRRLGDEIAMGEEWLERAEIGSIHSVIESGGGHTIIDQTTGQAVASGVRYGGETSLGIGGRTYSVTAETGFSVAARRTGKATTGAAARYATGSGKITTDHPLLLREYLGVQNDQWPVIAGGRKTLVFHLGGFRRKAVLELIAHTAGVRVRVNEWALVLEGGVVSAPAWVQAAKASIVEVAMHDRLDGLERAVGRPYANKLLPDSMRVAEMNGWLCLKREVAAITSAVWVDAEGQDYADALATIAEGM